MIKKLTRHGNSAALIIDRPILELLGADIDTAFEIVTDGQALILTPVKDEKRAERFNKSMESIAEKYEKTFEELAK